MPSILVYTNFDQWGGNWDQTDAIEGNTGLFFDILIKISELPHCGQSVVLDKQSLRNTIAQRLAFRAYASSPAQAHPGFHHDVVQYNAAKHIFDRR